MTNVYVPLGPGGTVASTLATDPAFTDKYVQISDAFRTQLLITGEESYPRALLASAAVSSATGRLRVTYFKARKTEPIASVRTISGSTAAAATPSLCRVGIYTCDPSTYEATLAASVANDTSLWATANTEYLSTLSATLAKVAGTVYAVCTLCVTAAAAPTFTGYAGPGSGAMASLRLPPISGFVDAQADLPASFTVASLTGSANAVYSELIP